ncbi:hypothetical protein METHB2_610019 [Candidatus Methylobacter favarea]|uniref:Uncharacterized protein n=1 Tax=Candidatus Methylobacter favarea TaxID=2707345 RepID=A0A8S0X2W9_9GAMM|nr:hypothetical protein METHB2_610019 [Candidatus Methylobacter favarea]
MRPHWMTAEEYACAPETLVIRELKVSGKILMTTLTCPALTP